MLNAELTCAEWLPTNEAAVIILKRTDLGSRLAQPKGRLY